FPALAAEADLLAVLVAIPGLGRALVLAAPQRDVRGVHRHELVDDAGLVHAAVGTRLRGPRVALSDVEAVEDDRVLRRQHGQDVGRLAAVLAREHDHVVALLQLHHSTSGASEMIRMNFLSRSSRPTGPKMRVPLGCCWALMSTAAFSSKRM